MPQTVDCEPKAMTGASQTVHREPYLIDGVQISGTEYIVKWRIIFQRNMLCAHEINSLVIAQRGETTHSGVYVNKTQSSMIDPFTH